MGSLTDQLTITKYDDWLIFVQRLEELVKSGRARRIPPIRKVHFDDDEWYLDPETGEIYVYVEPDAPILPIWEKVDPFAQPKAPQAHPNDLSVISIGKISRVEAKGIRGLMDLLIRNGVVEGLVPMGADSTESWYKELQTGAVYRLIESADGTDSRWERVPQSELQKIVQ